MNTERLLQLADHLEKLDDQLWTYRHIVHEVIHCGTVGCALGHCPDLWPETWRVVDLSEHPDDICMHIEYIPSIPDDVTYGTSKEVTGAAIFFGLTNDEAYSIFVGMPWTSTKYDVATKIRNICKEDISVSKV